MQTRSVALYIVCTRVQRATRNAHAAGVGVMFEQDDATKIGGLLEDVDATRMGTIHTRMAHMHNTHTHTCIAQYAYLSTFIFTYIPPDGEQHAQLHPYI